MTSSQIEVATQIYSFFTQRGWTKQSICGMLGNIMAECSMIPDTWEVPGNPNYGYGIVQWTPSTNYTNWAAANGLDYRLLTSQCSRIQWELENGQQYYATSQYPLTFRQFTQSTNSPSYLAKAFIYNYERPANYNQPNRSTWAEEFYTILSNSNPGTGTEDGTYVVQSGDTLTAIAAKYGVTISDLIAWNNISDPNLIKVGQVLYVREPATNWKATGTATCTADYVNVRATPNGTIIGQVFTGNRFEVDGTKSDVWVHVKVTGIGIGYIHEDYVKYDVNVDDVTYTVKSGDTLYSIAAKYSVTVSDIVAWNNISDASKIYVGQVLIVKKVANSVIYTVKTGDTLYSIAAKYGVTVAQLVTWNNISDVSKIFVGQVLIVG